MIAFHGDPAIKEHYLARLAAHEAADEIIHGVYWEKGKGCAVGCTVHSSSHAAYETELEIPIALARLEDTLFEHQRNGDSKTFPRRFLEAITPGADLSRVVWQFLHWLLTEELTGRDDPRVAAQIKRSADVLVPLMKGEPVDKEEARNAAYAAYAAYNAYDAAAASAASAASAAYAAYDADAAKRMADKLLELMARAPMAPYFARDAA